MPLVNVDIYHGHTSEYKKAILEGIHSALVSSFRIPDEDRSQILRAHSEEDFERAGGRSKEYTIIEIKIFKGRTREAKRQLYRLIVENLGRNPGISPTDVLITLTESDLVNWGVSGGKCADEVDLGFDVNV